MDQDEAGYGGCDRIFGVLEWAGLNGLGWASMGLGGHVSQCLNGGLSQYLESEHYIYEKVTVK